MHLNDLNGTGHAKDSKTLVLAAFFAYFLPLLAKSMPPEAEHAESTANSLAEITPPAARGSSWGRAPAPAPP